MISRETLIQFEAEIWMAMSLLLMPWKASFRKTINVYFVTNLLFTTVWWTNGYKIDEKDACPCLINKMRNTHMPIKGHINKYAVNGISYFYTLYVYSQMTVIQ